MATAKELSKRLNISFHTLSRWREEGLPFEKVKGVFQYDPVRVAYWLLETGKATREGQLPKTDDVGPVMTKIRECAVFFGVHERTVKGWLQDPSFPGRAGKRGDPNTAKGHFPAKSIAIWLQQSGKRSKVQIPVSLQLPDATTQPVQPTARDRLVDVKTEQAMLELKRMQGKMVDAEEALAFYRRTNAYAVTVLKSLPSQLQSALPANVGNFNLEDNPFWAEIIDAFLDPFVRQISVKKSTQIGGTLTLIAVSWALSEFDPAPAMIVGPDEVYCNELKERIYANGEESPKLQPRVPPERLRNSRHVDFGTCRAYLAWAGSAQRLRGRPCKRVFRSEIDVYPKNPPKGGNPIKATDNRVKRFYDSTIYDESSPWGDDSTIDKLYDAGHRARWMCKCPTCGERQELRFFVFKDGQRAGNGGIAGLKDEEGNFLAPEKVKDAHYLCVNGCRIDQDQKSDFVKSGKWVAEGQSIVNDVVVGEPTRGRKHLSFHLWAIHSPITTFNDLAYQYLAARRDSTLREFFENWLGLKYESRKKLPEWHILGERLSCSYGRGTIPAAVWFLTAGVDVQDDGCWYTIRGWGDQSTSWLIDWGFLQRYDTEDFDPKYMTEEQLNQFFRSDIAQVRDAVLNRHFPIFGGGRNPMGRDRLRPRLVLMDSNHRTREVHAFCAKQEEWRMRACRGDHKTKPSERFRVTEVEKPARGGPSYITPRKVTQIFTPHYKEAIAEKVILPSEAPGSFNFFGGVVGNSSDYLRQLFNEQVVDSIDRTTGRRKSQWKTKNEQWGNHCGDTEVYGFCAAEIVLYEMGATWDASTWAPPEPDDGESVKRLQDAALQVVARDYQLL